METERTIRIFWLDRVTEWKDQLWWKGYKKVGLCEKNLDFSFGYAKF